MRILLPAFLAALTLAADPLPTFDVFPGQPPGETLKMKEGQDPHGTRTPGHRGNVFAPELTPWPSPRPASPIILICPGDIELLRHRFRCQSHSPVVILMSCFCNSVIRSRFVTSHWNITHAFRTACNNAVCHS